MLQRAIRECVPWLVYAWHESECCSATHLDMSCKHPVHEYELWRLSLCHSRWKYFNSAFSTLTSARSSNHNLMDRTLATRWLLERKKNYPMEGARENFVGRVGGTRAPMYTSWESGGYSKWGGSDMRYIHYGDTYTMGRVGYTIHSVPVFYICDIFSYTYILYRFSMYAIHSLPLDILCHHRI